MTAGPDAKPTGRLAPNVIALSAVSLLTDVSSEMITPLLPAFVASLGGGATFLGAIEGAADTVAAILKPLSGAWSDRARRRKPLVAWGYAVASFARPLVGLATAAWHVLAIRVVDRVGKGLRTAPRDALIADSTAAEERGRAFGVHRAADHAGAVVGALLAFALLSWSGLDVRGIFLLAAVPAVLSLVVLWLFVREPKPAVVAGRPRLALPRMPARAWAFFLSVLVFTLGRSSEAFLLLRSVELGLAPRFVPLAWAAAHVLKSMAAAAGGSLSDRAGRRAVVAVAWIVQAGAFAGLALPLSPAAVAGLLLLAAAALGFGEGGERALVAELAPEGARGAAFGAYNMALAAGALPAALLFGGLWDAWGASAAFGYAAVLGLAATAGLLVAGPRREGITRPS